MNEYKIYFRTDQLSIATQLTTANPAIDLADLQTLHMARIGTFCDSDLILFPPHTTYSRIYHEKKK